MKIITTYDEIDREEWERLVRTNRTGTWFQTPEAYDFFNEQKDLFKPFVVGIEASPQPSPKRKGENHPLDQPHVAAELPSLKGRIEDRPVLRAVCVGYVTKEKNALMQFFTRRAIIIGGPAIADDCTEEEVYALMSAVKNLPSLQGRDGERPIYIETRNFNDYSRWKVAFEAAGFHYRPHLNFHVDTTTTEIAEANINKSRKRDIKTTIREGVKIISLKEPLHSMSREQDSLNEPHCVLNDAEKERMVHEYYLILKNLYETKVKTPLFPESFFQKLAKHPDGRILLTEYKGKIIGGTVCVMIRKGGKDERISGLEDEGMSGLGNEGISGLEDGGVVYEWFVCGEDGVYPHVFPSSYATYAGIRYAAEHGCGRFDMMGAGSPEERYGVRDFKARFGGQEVEHGRFIHINNEWLYRNGAAVVAMRRRGSLLPVKKNEKPIPLPDMNEWRQFVAQHPQGTIFHTPEMYKVYEQTKRQQPLVVSVSKEGKIRGLLMAVIQWNVGEMVRPLTARSIIMGGPLAENNNPEIVRELMQAYQKRLPAYVIYSEVRPIYEMERVTVNGLKDEGISGLGDEGIKGLKDEGLTVNGEWKRVGHYNLALQVDKSVEELWNGMHKERRRNIGQAQKAGLRFEEVRTEAGRRAIITLLQKTYARKHIPMADESLFAHLTKIMPKHVHFFAAYYEDKMIAGQIRLGYKDLLYAWYAGSDEAYFKMRPNDFLMWHVILWAHEKGYSRFDFGGGGEPGKPYGVRDYKLKYGCEMKDMGRWLCVHRPLAYQLGVIGVNLMRRER